ncbi:ImmA/IrrE family metallo-endopeptidase [Mycobacteroides abscessus]|uniref:ImmA/IrrE family metallo-endopeptidase n=1 Tax=Mycobacteroides abscessus TaxID=36809 RepID=UPI0009A5613D|nr:ImmA/IrrE family metallo-endopeptidase [Mycobacteroides abscessus]SKD26281.1 putative Zn peptidase [Mycobacteroides abscessus subsp. massiliense]SKI14375.1 putative Zn peptidase [Mycobacteroides abscessus subsp. massiliense]SKL96648.1 putative Zn peptidase [Mycobacteroides abscessus subsp. massiliense]SKM69471.1 putative Zn peptidase [Mycobacteroides abscessus subsp. massiliense]SKN53434.1 putative Zn peptidase [Mycobacteroides abscessus subsp. massiliense]
MPTRHTTQPIHHLSVLALLRACVPPHDDITFDEALQIAEHQAAKLLELHGISDSPVPETVITGIPHIRIINTARLGSSTAADGACTWDTKTRRWVILLNRANTVQRQRSTLAHEFKHVLDHPIDNLYKATHRLASTRQAEHAATYFAGCLLIPRELLHRAWHSGIRHPAALATLFQASEHAITVRLRQTGLIDQIHRSTHPLAPTTKELTV